jgi:hypothetical protein
MRIHAITMAGYYLKVANLNKIKNKGIKELRNLMYLSNPLSPPLPYSKLLFTFITFINMPFKSLRLMHYIACCCTTKWTLNLNLQPFAYHYSSSSSNKAILSSVRQDIHITLPSTNSELSLSVCLLHQWQISLIMTKLWYAAHLNVMLSYGIITNQYHTITKHNILYKYYA